MGNETKHLTMEQAAAALGKRRAGRPTHADTVRKWCTVGLRGVKLQSQVRGLNRVTTADWIEEFFDAITRVRDGARAATHGPAPEREAVVLRGRREAKEELIRTGRR